MYIYEKTDFDKYLYENCHCCNAGQTLEERRLKYAIARYFGKNYYDSRILRDWNKQPFAKYFSYSSWNNLMEAISEEFKTNITKD